MKCTLNCQNIENADITATPPEGECACLNSLVWNSVLALCVRDCRSDANAIEGISVTACSCNTDFLWNSEEDKEICAKDCSQVDKANNSVGISVDECSCRSGSKWSAENETCEQICQSVKYSNGFTE